MPFTSLALAFALVASGGERDVDAQVRALLGAFDRPISDETWRDLGPEGEAALAEIALSDELPSLRARALEGLAAFDSQRAREIHRRVARDVAEPRAVRRSAVRGLGRLLPPERSTAELRPLVERDRDPGVRAAAAEALVHSAPSEGCAVVRAQARLESERERTRFRRALSSCARR